MTDIATQKDYVAALSQHDWSFEYSDDASVWRKGLAELKAIEKYQQEHDKDFETWNMYCHKRYQRASTKQTLTRQGWKS